MAAFLALLVALRTPPAWSLDIGAADDSRFISGMLDRERDPANGAMFRWTEPLAQIWLPGTDFGSFALGLHIYNDTPLVGSRELHIERGGRALGSLQLAEGWRFYRVLLPGSAGDTGLDTPPLELATTRGPHARRLDRSRRPARLGAYAPAGAGRAALACAAARPGRWWRWPAGSGSSIVCC